MLSFIAPLVFAAIAQSAVRDTPVPPPIPFQNSGMSWSQVLSGRAVPLSFKLEELDEGYQAVELVVEGAPADSGMGGGMMGAMFGMVMGATNPFADVMAKHWTNGSTLTVAGHEYLVTYKAKVNPDPQSMMGGESDMPKFVTSDELRLTLVRSDRISSLSPTGIDKAKAIELKNQPPEFGGLLGALGGMTSPDTGTHEVEAELPPKAASFKAATRLAKAILSYVEAMGSYPQPDAPEDLIWLVSPEDELQQTSNPNGGAFVLNPRLRGTEPSGGRKLMFYDSIDWPDGSRLVGYTDGSIAELNRSEWALVGRGLGTN